MPSVTSSQELSDFLLKVAINRSSVFSNFSSTVLVMRNEGPGPVTVQRLPAPLEREHFSHARVVDEVGEVLEVWSVFDRSESTSRTSTFSENSEQTVVCVVKGTNYLSVFHFRLKVYVLAWKRNAEEKQT